MFTSITIIKINQAKGIFASAIFGKNGERKMSKNGKKKFGKEKHISFLMWK